MIDQVAILVDKITGKRPETEIQAKQYLNEFLSEKYLTGLELELRDLIDISINYTQLNSVVYLNQDFLKLFNKDGSLKLEGKKYLNLLKSEQDNNRAEEVRVKIRESINNKNLIALKTTKGISFKYKGSALFLWNDIYLLSEKMYGNFKMTIRKKIKKEDEQFYINFGFRILKNSIEGLLSQEQVIIVIKALIDRK